MKRSALVPALVLVLAAGCARQPRPATVPGTPATPRPGIAALRADLAAIFRTPAFSNAIWGVTIRSLKSGETVFALNPGTLLMPASNMKVVTAATAAERLGWSYRFDTRLVSAAPVENGVLQGDVIVVGSGDPSLGGRPGDAAAVLDSWADQLRAAGITRVTGNIVGDDDALDDVGLGRGWAWDDLGYGYATPVGAVSFAENGVVLTFKPGPAIGTPAAIESTPAGHGLSIVSQVTTGTADSDADVDFHRPPGSTQLVVTGSVPLGKTDVTRTVSVVNPTAFSVGVLKSALVARGIAVDGDAVDIDALPEAPATEGARTLATWSSPPLGEIVKVMLKVSQNLYADTLLEVMGRAQGNGPGTAEAGRAAVRETLASWGLPQERYVQADGSGLSRYNYLTADLLVQVLTRMYEEPRHRTAFMDALPVAGVDGTLAGRMKGTAAEGNARAKTGSIANSRALSGFVTSVDGEPFVFSMLANNFNVPASEATAVIDRAVARLAAFRRR